MKSILKVLCVLQFVLIVVSIPVAYHFGSKHSSAIDDAHLILIQGEEDLTILQALHCGQFTQATKRMEARIWDVILPVYLCRNSFYDSQRIEKFLRDASVQLGKTSVVLDGIPSQGGRLNREGLSLGTNQTVRPESEDGWEEVFRAGAVANQEKHIETRQIVLQYLKRCQSESAD